MPTWAKFGAVAPSMGPERGLIGTKIRQRVQRVLEFVLVVSMVCRGVNYSEIANLDSLTYSDRFF